MELLAFAGVGLFFWVSVERGRRERAWGRRGREGESTGRGSRGREVSGKRVRALSGRHLFFSFFPGNHDGKGKKNGVRRVGAGKGKRMGPGWEMGWDKIKGIWAENKQKGNGLLGLNR